MLRRLLLLAVATGASCLAQTWTQMFPATVPTGSTFTAAWAYYAMAYDSARSQTVMFNSVGETWVWDGSNWTRKFPATSPRARSCAGMAFDAHRSEIVLFGGEANNASGTLDYLGDTWAWNGSTWIQRTPVTSPVGRSRLALVYDSERQQIVLFGGYTWPPAPNALLNDTWVWDGTTWTQQFPTNSPSARFYHAMAYDSIRGEAVLFGGSTGGPSPANDTWLWNGLNWNRAQTSTQPAGRDLHAMAFDTAYGYVLLFGGQSSTCTFSQCSDTWTWNGSSWTQQQPSTTPQSRYGHQLAYDSVHQQVVMFGGVFGSSTLGDTWVWGGGSPLCNSIVNNAVSILANGPSMFAAFTPNLGLTLSQAAASCGVTSFNWEQIITSLPDPVPFKRVDGTPITSASTPFNDPPPGGGYTYCQTEGFSCDSYPFYYSPAGLGGACAERVASSGICLVPVISHADTMLNFFDSPSDSCIDSPPGIPSLAYLDSSSVRGACNNMTAPYGTYIGFRTKLVGLQSDGTLVPFPDQWTWTDNFNGTSGGISTTVGFLPADPNSGTGGITITSINGAAQTPPIVSCSVSPNTLWPPNGRQVPVTVSGKIIPGTQAIPSGGAVYAVADEYLQIQPSGGIVLGGGGDYSFNISLIASRNGDDQDGRTYTIVVGARDQTGNIGSCSAAVIVPHDQGH